jgi:hypothetical protein
MHQRMNKMFFKRLYFFTQVPGERHLIQDFTGSWYSSVFWGSTFRRWRGECLGIQEEPAPIEGFLVRLTSQKGMHQRMNKMFFKRLY